MSHGLLMKKKEQHLQHQLMLQQQLHHSFPSPITPTYDKKVFSSPSSSCRFDVASSATNHAAEVSSLYSSPTSSTASTPSSSSSNQRHYGQYPFNDVYGSGGGFLSSYASSSALPSPTIYPPTPPPSTPWIHPAWFGSSLESAGYMKTPKNNPFDN
jgi:hypothetical protein